jgi:hypothetical protein
MTVTLRRTSNRFTRGNVMDRMQWIQKDLVGKIVSDEGLYGRRQIIIDVL